MSSYSILGSDPSARLRCLCGFQNQLGIQQYIPAIFLASILGVKLPLDDECQNPRAVDVPLGSGIPSKIFSGY